MELILTATDGNQTRPAVNFTLLDGSTGTGAWASGSPPRIGSHHVELELPATRRWSDIDTSPDGAAGFAPGDGGQRLIGKVLDLDRFGVLTLEVLGAITLIDTEGDAPFDVVGSTVSVPAEDLEIHNCNL